MKPAKDWIKNNLLGDCGYGDTPFGLGVGNKLLQAVNDSATLSPDQFGFVFEVVRNGAFKKYANICDDIFETSLQLATYINTCRN